MDAAGDDSVEGFGDDGAKQGGEVVAQETYHTANLQDAPQEYAADARQVLQGLDQGGLEAVEGLLEPTGDALQWPERARRRGVCGAWLDGRQDQHGEEGHGDEGGVPRAARSGHASSRFPCRCRSADSHAVRCAL